MTGSIARRGWRLTRGCLVAGLLAWMASHAPVSSLEAQGAYGIVAKRPVMGGACAFCPWGALSDIVKEAMKSEGYDVQICYTCSAENSVRIVSEARVPGNRSRVQISFGSPPPPKAPVDFGATSTRNRISCFWEAWYQMFPSGWFARRPVAWMYTS